MENDNLLPFKPVPRSSTVLVVDDEDGIRRLLGHWVESLGYSVQSAGNADEALQMMQTMQVDAAVCDIRMPGHDGVWLIDQLRASYPATAIVIATGRTDMDPFVTLRSGVAGYLTKPFRVEELKKALENALAPNSPWVRDLHHASRDLRPFPDF
jgi:CheY-like chemotaxis protein